MCLSHLLLKLCHLSYVLSEALHEESEKASIRGGRIGKNQVGKFFRVFRPTWSIFHTVVDAWSQPLSFPAPRLPPHNPSQRIEEVLGRSPTAPTPRFLGPRHQKTREQMECHPWRPSRTDWGQAPSKTQGLGQPSQVNL
jgi:hypothetical protein